MTTVLLVYNKTSFQRAYQLDGVCDNDILWRALKGGRGLGLTLFEIVYYIYIYIYKAFHVSSPGAAREREIMLFSACV